MSLREAFFDNCGGKPIADLCPIERLIFEDLRRNGDAGSVIGDDGVERVGQPSKARAAA